MAQGRNLPKWIAYVRYDYDNKGWNFDIDHPYRIKNSKSFVFYPYGLGSRSMKYIVPFVSYLKKKGYELHITGNSEYGYGTLKVVMKHKDDPSNIIYKKEGYREVIDDEKRISAYWKARRAHNLPK